MVRVALLGMAHVHAGGYAQSVQRNPDAEITCVWDDDPERGRPAAEQYGVPYVSDLQAAVTRDDVDGVVVNAPTSQHPEVIGAALAARKHVFTEKALTIRTKESDELVATVRQSGVKFMISLPSRTRAETLVRRKAPHDGLWGL